MVGLAPWASLLVDTYFLDEWRGWVVGGKTEAKATRNNVKAIVLYTENGGETWTNRAADLMASAQSCEWAGRFSSSTKRSD